MRDITLSDTTNILFTSRSFETGVPTVLAGSPVVSAYEDNSATQITAGITLGVDHDSVVGLNLLTIAATGGNGYELGKDYTLVITTGTVAGVSVVGEVVGEFTIGRSAAAVDLANGTDGLSALKTLVDAVDTVVDAILVDTGTTLDGKINTIDTVVDAILVDTGTTLDGKIDTIDGIVDAILVDTGTTLDSALAVVDANVDQIEAAVITNAAGADVAADIIAIKAETATIVADTNELQVDDIPGKIAALNDPAVGAIADAVLDEALSGHTSAGTLGKAIADTETDATAILVDTGTTLDGKIDTIDGIVDSILVDTGTTLDGKINTIDGIVDAILVDTGTTLDGKINTIDGIVDAIVADTNELQGDWANGGRLDLILDAAAALVTTQMTESYASDGTAPTPAQALFLLVSVLSEFSISGTTLTAKKLDGSTTSATFTLNDGTNPTSLTRAS